MKIYTIDLSRETLHGHFSPDLPSILTIDSGDTVRYRTLDADWFVEYTASLEHPPTTKDDIGKIFSPLKSPDDDGHALCGPVAIRDAQPGMMLAVHINRVVPGAWGWVYPRFGTPKEQESKVPVIFWQLDAESMTGRNQHGHIVALRPFMGVMGVAPAEPGIHPTAPPRMTGGNIDCKELVAGSTLYLPIAVDGALFSIGDGHAAQGDGESGGTAIECSMDLVDVSFEVIEEGILQTPFAKTPTGWITFGFDEDLQTAHDSAQFAMQDLIAARYEVDRLTALGLMGVAVDMRITQTVNGVQGVHAVLPHGALR